MRIIGYTFEADVQCPACTIHMANVGRLRREPPITLGVDENGLPMDLVDREGNLVHPVFDIDEHEFTNCGACGAAL